MAELAELHKKIERELAVGKEEDIAIIKLVEDLMEYGYHSRASDVHVDPELDRVRIRLRVDGVLQDAFVFPKKIQQEIITRIKVLSGLRTDEHQAAQDGRFRAAVA
ncbi:MAG: ATPase, T2SS/T4P/T4SS family, partial [Patescibacteria group bacterium]